MKKRKKRKFNRNSKRNAERKYDNRNDNEIYKIKKGRNRRFKIAPKYQMLNKKFDIWYFFIKNKLKAKKITTTSWQIQKIW